MAIVTVEIEVNNDFYLKVVLDDAVGEGTFEIKRISNDNVLLSGPLQYLVDLLKATRFWQNFDTKTLRSYSRT